MVVEDVRVTRATMSDFRSQLLLDCLSWKLFMMALLRALACIN